LRFQPIPEEEKGKSRACCAAVTLILERDVGGRRQRSRCPLLLLLLDRILGLICSRFGSGNLLGLRFWEENVVQGSLVQVLLFVCVIIFGFEEFKRVGQIRELRSGLGG